MMRSTVFAALDVCSVPKTRWPVSAAVRASEMVSRSRISPTRMTSGSSRSALLQGRRERPRVRADLALVDQAALRLVHELDRVLDGQDVRVPSVVDVVDHGGERRRLARAGRAGHEHETALFLAELLEDRRQVQGLERRNHRRDAPQHRPRSAILHEDVHPEPADAVEGAREVELMLGREALLLLRCEHGVDEAHHVLGARHRMVERRQVAVDAQARGLPGAEMQVGGVLVDGLAEELFHGRHAVNPLSSGSVEHGGGQTLLQETRHAHGAETSAPRRRSACRATPDRRSRRSDGAPKPRDARDAPMPHATCPAASRAPRDVA